MDRMLGPLVTMFVFFRVAAHQELPGWDADQFEANGRGDGKGFGLGFDRGLAPWNWRGFFLWRCSDGSRFAGFGQGFLSTSQGRLQIVCCFFFIELTGDGQRLLVRFEQSTRRGQRRGMPRV